MNDLTQAQVASSSVAPPSPSAPSSSTAAVGAAARSSGVSPGGSSAAAASQGRDQATIGSVSGVLATALNGSDVRTSKVAALQASITAGTYNIPASSVADRMLSSILGS